MAAMPAMDDDGKKPKKGIDLAIIFGKPKKKPGSMEHDEPEGDEGGETEGDGDGDELPPGFEDAASEAFPELAGDQERLNALHRMIRSCTGSY